MGTVLTENRELNTFQLVLLKMFLVMFTCALAIAIPDLGDFIALIGACASSLLALVFPPLIDLLTNRSVSPLSLTKNIFIMSFGIVGGIVGPVTSIMSVVAVLTSPEGEDECIPIDWLSNATYFNSTGR